MRALIQHLQEAGKDIFKGASPEEVKARRAQITHDYKCIKCGKPAIWAREEVWHYYDIAPDGDLTEQDASNTDNMMETFCKEHGEEEGFVADQFWDEPE